MEVKEIVKFVRENSTKLPLGKLSDEELENYIRESINENSIRVYCEGDKIEGLVIFQRGTSSTKLFVEQVFCNSRSVFRGFLRQLQFEFPLVTEIYGKRQKSGKIKRFNLNTLEKVINYGW